MNWRKWCDDFVLANKGILLATKENRFWYGFVPSFLLFGLLMNLLSGGLSKFELIRISGFAGGLRIIGENFLAIFGFHQPFLDWLPVFFIALLQGILIGLIALLWHKKRQQNAANLESAGIITGLIALGAGCPTCGTTLITPLISAIFSTGSLAIASTVSTVVTMLAIIIAILSLKRLGLETYVTIINEKYLKKQVSKMPDSKSKQSRKSNQPKENHE
ncbi:hypothetical protein IKE82_00290 [Candidatus Saccharibacteria bacterium]|nr:hypothetical protein [Candidatus Saccharibacteria bacterium]